MTVILIKVFATTVLPMHWSVTYVLFRLSAVYISAVRKTLSNFDFCM